MTDKFEQRNKMHHEKDQDHIPVLLDEVLLYLDPKQGEKYLDLTAGYGGHAAVVLERTFNGSPNSVLVDRDENAIAKLEQKFAGRVEKIIHKDFLTAAQELVQEGRQFELILADLGVSSPHLNIASRGFSIQQDGPLDMRMDLRQSLTAEEMVNNYSEAELADIFIRYGEEPRAKKIARMITEHRPIKTTHELAKIVAHAWPGPSRVHPATRVFQALRIAVNNELDLLERALPLWIDLLAPGGRIAVISFHSLEDRIVKQFLSDISGDRYDAPMRLLTKGPVSGSKTEIVSNPRARSAKLRAAVKIKI